MTNEQLERGLELTKLIKTTSDAIDNLRKYAEPRPKLGDKFYEDGFYNLHICEWSDGSGKFSTNLNRNFGNEKLLKLIIEELAKQLKELQEEFDSL